MADKTSVNLDALLDEVIPSRPKAKKGDVVKAIDYSKYGGVANIKEGYTLTAKGIGSDGFFYDDVLPVLLVDKSEVHDCELIDDDIEALGDSMDARWDIDRKGLFVEKYTVH